MLFILRKGIQHGSGLERLQTRLNMPLQALQMPRTLLQLLTLPSAP
jgi:hypothetical protein